MNPELYTEEFRNFKYLKCSNDQVAYYKKVQRDINKIQPWAPQNDPNFVWPHQVEFVEQLLDLSNDIVYLVTPGALAKNGSAHGYDYEQAKILEIKNPKIYTTFPFENLPVSEMNLDDIPKLESDPRNFYLASFTPDWDDRIIRMDETHLIPSIFTSYSMMFYNKETAEKYANAITYFLRRNIDAISAISQLF